MFFLVAIEVYYLCSLFTQFVSVQLWRKVRSSEVREDNTESGTICSSSHWTLCLCRMEFRVPYKISHLSCCLFLTRGFGLVGSCSILQWFSLVMCRGFPVWLKYVPGISFRTDNEPFKVSFSLAREPALTHTPKSIFITLVN